MLSESPNEGGTGCLAAAQVPPPVETGSGHLVRHHKSMAMGVLTEAECFCGQWCYYVHPDV